VIHLLGTGGDAIEYVWGWGGGRRIVGWGAMGSRGCPFVLRLPDGGEVGRLGAEVMRGLHRLLCNLWRGEIKGWGGCFLEMRCETRGVW